MTTPVPAPPYALAPISFRFPALAALCARAPLGGPRETALACFMAARLGAALLAPHRLAPEAHRDRADGARAWLSSQAVVPAARTALASAMAATGAADRAATAAALESAADAAAGALDAPAAAEIARLVTDLRADPGAITGR